MYVYFQRQPVLQNALPGRLPAEDPERVLPLWPLPGQPPPALPAAAHADLWGAGGGLLVVQP